MQTKVGDLFGYVAQVNEQGQEKGIVIAHVCNDVGGWGSGFVVPLGRAYPRAELAYRNWHKEGITEAALGGIPVEIPFELGNAQIVRGKTDGDVWVANMVAQHSTITRSPGSKPIRYAALVRCMQQVGDFCREHEKQIYCPKFGSDLAGGTWEFIAELIDEIWDGIPVTLCVLEE